MKFRLVSFLFCLFILFSSACSENRSQDGVEEDAQDSLIENERDLLSVSGLEISQGERGVEIWTLVAESAKMQEEGGVIWVEAPLLTYFVNADKENASDNAPVTVESLKGEVDQANNMVSFIENVHAQSEDNAMYSRVLEYRGDVRALLTPEKTHFFWAKGQASADTGIWELDSGVFSANGNVEVEWEMDQPGGLDLPG